jgi:hypothetical protein
VLLLRLIRHFYEILQVFVVKRIVQHFVALLLATLALLVFAGYVRKQLIVVVSISLDLLG